LFAGILFDVGKSLDIWVNGGWILYGFNQRIPNSGMRREVSGEGRKGDGLIARRDRFSATLRYGGAIFALTS
jgi:hypothetical protein